MGRYIVLEIDDDECVQGVLNNPPQGAKVIGMFHKATKFCQCENIRSKDGVVVDNHQFVRGSKFGLYVHRECKLPRAGHQHYLRNMLVEERIGYGFGLYFNMTQPYIPHRKFGKAS